MTEIDEHVSEEVENRTKYRAALRKYAPILGIVAEVAIVRKTLISGVGTHWVTNCPICRAEGQFVLVREDTFQCGSCRITGDVVDALRLFRRGTTVEDAIHYVAEWVRMNPSGKVRVPV